MELVDLRNRLAVVPAGRLIGALGSEVQSLLIASWDQLKGSDAEGTTGSKLAGRIESLEWAPPNLTFVIERHGGTVHGSTRAELHDWTVNIETGEADVATRRFRQLDRRAPAMDVAPMCIEIALAIESRQAHPALTWKDDRAELRIGILIPDYGFARTVAGRRKRFRTKLESALPPGWVLRLKGTRTYIEKAPP
jgi:hypothetical protein